MVDVENDQTHDRKKGGQDAKKGRLDLPARAAGGRGAAPGGTFRELFPEAS